MNKDRLIKAVNEFKNRKIIVIGDIILDKYTFGKVERINPERKSAPLIKVEREEYRLGGAGNVAANLASLEVNVSLYCLFGDDYHGKIIEELCEKNKINLTHFYHRESIVKERFIEAEFGDYLLRSDSGESNLEMISQDGLNYLSSRLQNEKNVEAIILSDYNKKMFRNGAGKLLIENRNIPCIVDPKPENIGCFKDVDLIKTNIKEAREITGMKEADEMAVFRDLCNKTRIKNTVVTCGKNGMICYDGKEINEIPTKTREVIDVCGAGDTCIAVIGLGFINKLKLVESAQLANYAAGIVVQKQGTATLTRHELIARIMEN